MGSRGCRLCWDKLVEHVPWPHCPSSSDFFLSCDLFLPALSVTHLHNLLVFGIALWLPLSYLVCGQHGGNMPATSDLKGVSLPILQSHCAGTWDLQWKDLLWYWVCATLSEQNHQVHLHCDCWWLSLEQNHVWPRLSLQLCLQIWIPPKSGSNCLVFL